MRGVKIQIELGRKKVVKDKQWVSFSGIAIANDTKENMDIHANLT